VADLVDDETWWKCGDSTSWNSDCLTTYRTAERPNHRAASATSRRSSHLRVDDMFQTTLTDCVRAGEQFGSSFDAVINTQACAARQETVAEVLIVDWHCLDERRRHSVTAATAAASRSWWWLDWQWRVCDTYSINSRSLNSHHHPQCSHYCRALLQLIQGGPKIPAYFQAL